MRFTKEVVEEINRELCAIADNEPDDCSPNHTVFAKCMAMCRRWNSLLELEAENAELRANWAELKDWAKGERINYNGDDRYWIGFEAYHFSLKGKMNRLEQSKEKT